MPLTGSVFLQGLALSLGLIVAIGAQNAFILRQGLRREHVTSVVLFCAVTDALLIAAGVLGMAQALGERPLVANILALAGAVFWQFMAGKPCAAPRNQAVCWLATRVQDCAGRRPWRNPRPSPYSTRMCTWTLCCWLGALVPNNLPICRCGLWPVQAVPA